MGRSAVGDQDLDFRAGALSIRLMGKDEHPFYMVRHLMLRPNCRHTDIVIDVPSAMSVPQTL